MKVVVGIPARMGSSRFPGKPLAKILGMPMIEHVYKRSQLAQRLDDIFVATCDDEIFDSVVSFGGKAVMTPKEISRPGLRVAEACKNLPYADDDIIVVVQGDEPLVHPGMVDLAVAPLLEDSGLHMGTLVAEANEIEWQDTNEVKVVADTKSNILFMSRSPIPSNTRNRIGPRLKQVAIMPFRKRMLLAFQELQPTPLEIAESIELLRALEHGITVRAINSAYVSISVDTEPDLREAQEVMTKDQIYPRYARLVG
jgi:3-deoxy-manno-octulosonate cytidylyltransferase (CMP-KDO synthetase)